MSAVDADAVPSAAVTDTLMGFYARFGHLALDTVERMGKDPASGIEITDRTRRPCLVCAQGKQTRARQQTKDNGAHAPIDKVGEVICSDLKGPMTPMDHLGNRYMVNFIDHKSNCCQVFLAKRKNEAAKMLQEFFVKFEKRFDLFSDPGKRSMTQRACECVTVGKDDPTKDYKVYLPSERKVITTRHVQNILVGEKTLNEEPTTAQLLTAAANGEKEESAA
ncbi:hypothetical protein PC110_g17530 [Phytophthora cactorum]|uniref:Retroviral polymerase SH3-like domain-containing protein n=1 Tax=Phytophthora cactorum TaxID=29920 RepID=A0A329RNW2_9STRA|nr:hypothetical protein PC110_g17530 [Phytophthora cactorum]